VNLYLHIGTEKTGTTSIQKFFRSNRELLRRRGVLYPVTPGNENHTGLTVAALELARHGPLRKIRGIHSPEEARKFRADFVDQLAGEFQVGEFHTVVMSGEHCSSRLLDDGEVQWLKDFLSRHFEQIKIVVYIRRQDDYLLSTYSTAVKSGATVPLQIPGEETIENRYDHWRLISRWARIFGRENIICRKYEKSALRSGDVVEDFLFAAGLESGPDYVRPDNVNESLDAEMLEFLRLFNRHIPRFAKKSLNPNRDNIVRLLSKMSRGPLITLDEAELARFMGLFAESNRRVAVEYFGGARTDSDDPLFERRTDSRPRRSDAELSVERAVEICAGLWLEKQAQLDRAQERVRSMTGGEGPARLRRRRKFAAQGQGPAEDAKAGRRTPKS
jgi:hypothetical protein